jgi:hypothetical protein
MTSTLASTVVRWEEVGQINIATVVGEMTRRR